MKIIFAILFTISTLSLSSQNKQVITLNSLLNEMVDANAVARWGEPEYTLHQASSYDRLSVSSDLPEGSAAIRLLTLKLSDPTPQELIKAWSLVIFKMEFDGHQTVWCPLGDFAGSGFGGHPLKAGTANWTKMERRDHRLCCYNLLVRIPGNKKQHQFTDIGAFVTLLHAGQKVKAAVRFKL